METPRWRRIEEHFDAALARPVDERAAFIAGIDDPEIGAEVASLLRASESAAGFLEVGEAQVLTLPPGERIGPWQVVRSLGTGGMGEVLEVERADGAFEQRAALKLVRIEAAHLLERFDAERRIQAQLEHPGIARLLDGGIAPDGRPYAVMEYVDGLAITDWCRKHGAGLRERIELFLQVCDAVAYAHGQGVIHCDIKPENVLVSHEGDIKVADFGLARAASNHTGTGMALMGTVSYMSPELVTGEQADERSDVYALGIVIFEMLTGERPFSGESAVSIAVQHTNSRVPAPSSLVPAISAAVDDLVLHMTEPAPEDRPADASEVLILVQHLLDNPAAAVRLADRDRNDDDATQVFNPGTTQVHDPDATVPFASVQDDPQAAEPPPPPEEPKVSVLPPAVTADAGPIGHARQHQDTEAPHHPAATVQTPNPISVSRPGRPAAGRSAAAPCGAGSPTTPS